MDNLSIAAVSGLQSRMISLDLLANNLANSATSGFKVDREYYGLYSGDESSNAIDGGTGSTLPTIEKQFTDFSIGVMEETGNPLDISINGKGFFAVAGPKGPLYTRNGRLQVLPGGELGNSDGQAILSSGGAPIRVLPHKQVNISPDGRVQQENQILGTIGVFNFKSTDPLKKSTASTFENTDPGKNPATPAANVEVEQGKLEGSNVQVADAAMRLVGVMRQFEMLQKAIGVSTDMDNKSISEVARVTTG